MSKQEGKLLKQNTTRLFIEGRIGFSDPITFPEKTFGKNTTTATTQDPQ
jgi:hypothetical protein